VVREIEIGDGLALGGWHGPRDGVYQVARASEEQVGRFFAAARSRLIEETQIERIASSDHTPVAVPQSDTHLEIEARGGAFGNFLRAFPGQEEGQVADVQRVPQPLSYRREHRIEIGFRTQLARELDHLLAVIVAVAVEVAIEPLLYPVA